MLLSFTGLLNFRKSGIVLCLLGLSLAVFADERPDTTKTYEISEVTVTEQYRNTEVRASAPLQILSSKQIEKLNALQVSDAVKYFSGVTVKDYGGIGGLKTVSVRSLGAAHTAVSYDGITLTDCQTGQIDIGRFSLDNVDLLSLNNGQSDNIFQPARMFASASLLNIRTLTPKFANNKTLNGKVSLKGGSFGLLNPSFLLQQKISPKYAASLSGEWLSANGDYPYILTYSSGSNALKTTEKRLNSDVANIRIEGNIYYSGSENESGKLKVYYYNSDRGLPGATIFYNQNAFISQRLNDYTFFAQTYYQKEFSPIVIMQINAKYHRGFTHYTDTTYHNQAGYEENRHFQNEFYGSASLLFRAFEHLSFSVSTDGFVNNLHVRFENESLTNNFPKPVRRSLLTVAAAKYVTNQILATGSLLSTLVSDKVKTDGNPKQYNRLSPYISFAYKPFNTIDLRFRTFYKNIFRLPTFNDMYYSRVAKPDLKPENTNQFNIGFTFSNIKSNQIASFTITADYFNNKIQDKIVVVPAKNLYYWSATNLGEVSISGIDLNAETVFSLSKSNKLLLSGTYNYQSAIDVTNPENNTYGHQIPYTPRVSGSARASLETNYGDISYSLLWSGVRYAGYQNYAENRLPGYSDQNISYSKLFQIKELALNCKIEMLNIFNENYAVIRYYPMPGRSLRASVSMKF